MSKIERALAEDLMVKSEFVRHLRQIIKDRKLGDSQVAKILNLESDQLTSLLHGQPRGSAMS
ncbi:MULTISPECIES: XRE family transcriptional regulator [Limnobaculum]|uniref:XRE family transcriptional regulator n=1 Tax=Limnobaculum TaxID=2172100 RepID=UPI003899178E